MKISTKLALASGLIIAITLMSSVVVFRASRTFEELSAEAHVYDKMVLAVTDFRAASRQMTVEAYQSHYLSGGKNRTSFEISVKKADEKFHKLNFDGFASAEQVQELHSNIDKLVSLLTESLDLQAHGHTQQAHGLIKSTLEIFFKKNYLDKIEKMLKIIDARNQEIENNINDAALDLSHETPMGLITTSVVIVIFLIPLIVSFRRKVGLLLQGLDAVDFEKNIFPKTIIEGHDEFALVASRFNDLTHNLSETKAHLEKQQKDLVRVSRLTSLGEMSAGLAHEINNPLTIIEGATNLLSRYKDNIEQFDAKIATINKASTRIAKIVSGLRKFSRSDEQAQQKYLSLASIVQEAQFLTEAKSKRSNTSVHYDLKSDAKIQCNDVEIEQVIVNLIGNAIDAVKNNQEKWVKVSVFDDGANVILRVMDSGQGISHDIVDKLFSPFFTTKKVGEGTGLGLSISKGILDEHKASIAVLSDVQNTCFEVRFPKSDIGAYHAA